MNTPDENLHTLIRALTKSEKRYFKLFVKNIGGKTQTNYAKLFDAIAAQVDYNEAKIKKKFAKEKFIKQLSVTKHYLFKLVLKSLANFHSDDIETEIFDGLKHVRILYDKKLFGIALQQLERLRQLALNNDKIAILPIIVEWFMSLENAHFSYQKYTIEEFEQLIALGQDTIQAFEEQYQYLAIWSRLCFYSRKITYARKIKDIAAKIIDQLLAKKNTQQSDKAKILYHNILAISYQVNNKLQESLWHIKCLLEIFEAKTHLQATYNREYTTTLGNGIVLSNRAHEWVFLDKILAQAKKVQTTTRMSYITLQNCIYNAELPRMEAYATVEELETKIKEVNAFLEEEWDAIPPAAQMTLCFFIARGWFSLEKYDRVIIALEKILSHNRKLLPTIYSSAKILLLITYYEQGEHLLLPYAVRSAYRYLKHKDELFEFEKVMLNFLKKAIEFDNRAKLERELKLLQEKIVALLEHPDPTEREPLRIFMYTAWIASKLEYRSYMDIMREKAKEE